MSRVIGTLMVLLALASSLQAQEPPRDGRLGRAAGR